MGDKRSTGWKVPLLFCAGVLVIVGVTAFVRQEDMTKVPPLPAPLVEEAKAIHMNLDATEEGRAWKEQISSTAGSFATRAERDVKLTVLIRTAAKAQRFDAACTAAVLMYNDHQRNGVLMDVAHQAMNDCATLPWAVMAAGGMRSQDMLTRLHEDITGRWESCRKGK